MLKEILIWTASYLLWLLNLSINSTLKLKIVNKEIIKKIHEQGKSIIFACWHNSTFTLSYYYRNQKLCIMPIEALRGKILAQFAKRYKIESVSYPEKGSPQERIQSLLQVTKMLKSGYDVGVAVDGPPAPLIPFKAKPGIFLLAKESECLIIPVGVCAKKKITLFWRWDKYFIPLPFSKVTITFGEPLEKYETSELEEKINQL